MRRNKIIPFLAFSLLVYIFAKNHLYRSPQKETAKASCERPCLTDNIITVRHGGRLGNCVWEYVSVLSLGEALGLCPYVPKSIINCLRKVFKNMSLPAYEDSLLSEKCRKVHGGDLKECESRSGYEKVTAWDLLCYTLTIGSWIPPEIARKPVTTLRKLKDSGLISTILILPRWMTLPHVFDTFGIRRFQQEFQLRDDVKQLAEETLDGVKKKFGNGDMIFVGVHVRRTDYAKFLQKHHGKNVALADLNYYKSAMTRMHDLYKDSRMVFVVVSDDYTWCKNNLVNEKEGVYWGGLEHSGFINNWEEKRDMSVFHDLAVLSIQNHTIIGYGTFAVTGSLLSNGHTIVCNISRYEKVPNDFATHLSNILPNWEQL